jgi:GrpB-like predicted nucleotidyltransferase (UPF0157 family)
MKEKTLQDLTKEEIGQLFPIEICPYSDKWPKLYEQEYTLITNTLPAGMVNRIEHFGSTSVPGLSSKNTIDILMEVEFNETSDQQLIGLMKSLSYDFNWQNEGDQTHMVFVKGYDPSNLGQQTYHIHAGPKKHPLWDRIYFRDHLRKKPEVAHEYETLKKKLANKFKHDRVAYRIAKTEFVKEVTDIAKTAIF